MIRFRHKGCQSEVIRYVGQGNPILAPNSASWQLPDCTHPAPQSKLPNCPDCGEPVVLRKNCNIEPIPLLWGEPPMAPLYLS